MILPNTLKVTSSDIIKRKQIEINNLLRLVPTRSCRWHISRTTGFCVIRKKRFPHSPNMFQRFLLRSFRRDQFIKIYLDEFGTFVFRASNGKQNVQDIGERLHRKFGGNLKNILLRLASFYQNMESNGLIVFRDNNRTTGK